MALRNNQQIQGITMSQIENFLNQFADDADVFSMNTEASLTAIFEELEKFRLQSGFCISYDKTVLYRIGSLRHSDACLYSMDQVAWSNEDITVLGVQIAHDNLVQKNYESVQTKVKSVLNSWENRGLTLWGKVLIVNTLVASLFVYKMMVLPSIPDYVVRNIEGMIKRYLWGQGTARVAFEILKNPTQLGGLNLVNLKMKDKSLKATWPQILSKEEDYAKIVHGIIHPKLGWNIWRISLKPEHVKYLSINSIFWKQVLEAWCEFNYWHNREGDKPDNLVQLSTYD